MKPVLSILTVVIIGLLAQGAALALEIPLHYVRFPDETDVDIINFNAMSKSVEIPPGDWGVPVFNTKHPIYVFVQIRDTRRLLILDKKNISGKDVIYNRIYFDSNGNNDLTDDPVLDGDIIDALYMDKYDVYFPSAEMIFEIDGTSLSYSFKPKLYCGRAKLLEGNLYSLNRLLKNITIPLFVNCAYTGDFSVDGKKHTIAFIDANGNGTFDDITEKRFPHIPNVVKKIVGYAIRSDYLAVSSSDDIHCIYDRHIYGDRLWINGKMFEVNLDMKHKICRLNQVNEVLLPLKLSMSVDHLTLYAERSKTILNVFQPGEMIMVPEDNYRLLRYSVYRNDNHGDRWWLKTGCTTLSPVVSVDGSSESVLTIGEPYKPVMEVGGALNSNITGQYKDLKLNMEILGLHNEMITDLRHIEGTNTQIPLSKLSKMRPKEASFKIVKSDGEIVTQSSFRYG